MDPAEAEQVRLWQRQNSTAEQQTIEILRAMTEWQPIETAPAKGRILVWDGQKVHLAWLLCDVWQGAPYAWDEPLTDVTHWMPLPKPPKVKQ